MTTPIKALSVRQPDASRIARGEKTLEVRCWPTRYRGPLLICAAKRPRVDNLPIGVALCTVNVVGCRPMVPSDAAAACSGYDPESFVWELAGVEPVDPFPVTGRLGLFYVELKCAAAVA